MDVLSGSYSVMDAEMAGHFQVLYGKEGGGLSVATPMTFDGDTPLVVTSHPDSSMGMPNAICTRPYAADLDADGILDLVVGNFEGTFAFIEGLEDGAFAEEPIYLKDTKGEVLRVAQHSDPFLVDWDSDGDLDLVSGSDGGDVSLFRNVGTPKEPAFAPKATLHSGPKGDAYGGPLALGDKHVKGPQRSTRVAAADVNSDGKLDLLIGDSYTLSYAVDGLSKDEVEKRLAAWQEEMGALSGGMPEIDWPEDPSVELSPEDQAALDAYYDKMDAHHKKREAFLREESTGSVWLLLQK